MSWLSDGDAGTAGISYGGRFTLAGDVDGDGKADLVLVGNTGTTGTMATKGNQEWVFARSNGFSFQPISSGTSDPSVPLIAAIRDIDGDGKGDLVLVYEEGVTIHNSNGSGFNTGHNLPNGPFYGQEETLLADVSGDGKADLIAVNYGGTYVETSTGTGLGTSSRWGDSFVGQPYLLTGERGTFSDPNNFGFDYSPIGDWNSGSLKGECSIGQAVNGLSKSTSGTPLHDVHCTSDNMMGAITQQSSCHLMTVAQAENRGSGDPAVDWDTGSYKTECAANEYVQGVSQDPSTGEVNGIMCCPAANTTHNSNICEAQVFEGANSPAAAEAVDISFDWDTGYYKGQCPGGQFVAGVSTPGSSPIGVTGDVHALYCCQMPNACATDLSNVGTGDFTIQFTLGPNTQTGSVAIVNQRATCLRGNFWSLTMQSGLVTMETDDGTHYTSLSNSTPVNDDATHSVLVTRRSGSLVVSVDGNAGAAATSAASLSALNAVSFSDVCAEPSFNSGVSIVAICP